MSQHDYNIADQSGSSFLTDINNALAAIVSQNSGATEPATMFAYQWWADTTTGKLKLRNAANSAWIEIGTMATTNLGLALVAGVSTQTFSVADATAIAHAVRADQIQKQSLTAYTTAGTSTAYTITTLGTPIALTTGERWRVKFNVTAGATPTLNRDSKGAKALKLYDSTGAKVAASATTIIANMLTDVEYDGTDYVILNQLPASTYTPSNPLTLATQVASTSGVAIDFTSIPTGTKRIAVMLNGVSTNGTSYPIIQIGDSGGPETTGYLSGSANTGFSVTSSIGFVISAYQTSSSVHSGFILLTLMDSASNTWVASGVLADTNSSNTSSVAGSKSLTATLDRVRITTTNGTDTFDAGTINISYEG